MDYGFIYFAINPAMPGVVKIGMTTKHPQLRIAELSASTGCPQPFQLLAYFDVDQMRYVERCIHDRLDGYRVNERREFFRGPMSVFRQQMEFWGDSDFGCYVDLGVVEIATTEEMMAQNGYSRSGMAAQ